MSRSFSLRWPKLRRLPSLTLVTLVTLAAGSTAAQLQSPGKHAAYDFSLEPHLLRGRGGLGAGLRTTVPILTQGPMDSLNNDLALGFGIDVSHDGDDKKDENVVWLPVVAQWSFYLHHRLSVFAEAGVGLETDAEGTDIQPFLSAGGRFMVTTTTGVLLRAGFPYLSLGGVVFF